MRLPGDLAGRDTLGKSRRRPCPSGTSTLPPRSTADTSCLRKAGLGSICSLISCLSSSAPWEWPISTKPRPSLYLARYSCERREHAEVGLFDAAGVTPPGVLICKSVSCGYMGAYTLHVCEKRDAWSIGDLGLFRIDFEVRVREMTVFHFGLTAHRGVDVEAVDRRVARRLGVFDEALSRCPAGLSFPRCSGTGC